MNLKDANTRLATFGILAAAGSYVPEIGHICAPGASGIPLASALAAPLVPIAVGIAGNIIAADYLEILARRRSTGPALLRNPDLTLLVADAMAATLESARKATVLARLSDRETKKYKESLVKSWKEFAHIGIEPLEGLSENALTQLFKGDLQRVTSQSVLPLEDWRELLFAGADGKVQFLSGELDSLAAYYSTHFARHLFELFKEDASRNGKGYAALHLLLLSALQDYAERMLREQQQMKQELVELCQKGFSDIQQRVYALAKHVTSAQEASKSGEMLTADLQRRLEDSIDALNSFMRVEGQAVRHEGRQKVDNGLVVFNIARMPTTNADIVGRGKMLTKLSRAASGPQQLNLLSLIGFGGTGKSAIVNEWLAKYVHPAEKPLFARILIHSFYKQGTRTGVATSDFFLSECLRICGDPNPLVGTQWQRGERLALRLQKKKSLLVLDGLETLQTIHGHEAARLRDQAVCALLLKLAERNSGLCLVTSRYPISELTAFERSLVRQTEITGLRSIAAVRLLKRLGLQGPISQFRHVAKLLRGHCLTLQILATYLRDLYHGDIGAFRRVRFLEGDAPVAKHAFKIMAAYETQLDSPARSLLQYLAVFDRPTDRILMGSLCKHLSPKKANALTGFNLEWHLAHLRRTKLVLAEDLDDALTLDLHPLVREYFARSFQRSSPAEWRKAHRFASDHFAALASGIPANHIELDWLLRALVHSTHAGQESRALNQIYVDRILDGKRDHAIVRLGALGSTVSALGTFFVDGDWSKPSNRLKRTDQLFVLREAGRHLTALYGYSAAPVGEVYTAAKRVVGFSRLAPSIRFEIELGLIRFYRLRGELTRSGNLAHQLLNSPELERMPEIACSVHRAIAANCFYTANFAECARHCEMGLKLVGNSTDAIDRARFDVNEPGISCEGYLALAKWFIGEESEALKILESLTANTSQLGHPHTTAISHLFCAMVFQFEGDAINVEKEAGKMRTVCATNGFFIWRVAADFLLMWAQLALSRQEAKVHGFERLFREWNSAEAKLFLPYWRGLYAQAAHGAGEMTRARKQCELGLRMGDETGELWWHSSLRNLHRQILSTG